MKLYELSNNYNQVLDLIDEGAEMMCLQDTLDSLADAIEVKAENTAKIIKMVAAEVEALKLEEKRLTSRRTALENKSKGLREYLQSNLETAGLKKLKGKLFSFTIQSSNPSLSVSEGAKIPRAFMVKQPDKVDNKALIEALKGGKKVKGVQLKQSESLRIR